MPREYRNFNNVGKVSCLLVLLLAFLAVNPVMTAVYAENAEDNYSETSFGGSEGSNDSEDVATLDTTVSSTVGISFSPAKYYADLVPTNSAGQSARIDLQTTIYVSNSGGYAVYLKTDNPNLVGENNSNNFIPGATTAKTYTNMDVNTWGYAAAADVTSVSNNATYKAVIASGNGDKLAENTSDDIEVDTKTIALSFATKINDTKPADTYSNTMMLSVVSNPREIATWSEITTMQEMNPGACYNAPMGASKQLRDVRDGKYYWVGKLADGKCWMTQNLDLDLNTSTTPLTLVTSDVVADWTPGDDDKNPAYTEAIASSSTIYNNSTGQRSWSLGDYRIINPTDDTYCDSKLSNAAGCPERFAEYSTPTTANKDTNAHYILGNHYQWNAATAGTGDTITSGQASSSICPKGWRLPTGNYSTGEFATLITAGDIGSDITRLTSSPYYFVRGGEISQYITSLFRDAGYRGFYWSSTPNSNDGSNLAYRFVFNGATGINTSTNGDRQSGYPIRCLAR